MQTSNIFTGEERYEICEGIAAGLAYLHQLNIIHRDLKSSNILIQYENKQKKWIPKISDFGSAGRLVDSSFNADTLDGRTRAGCAPELIEAEQNNLHLKPTKETDIYSLGMVFWEILHRQIPSHNE